ncbi:hypothetical protein [Yersinia phage vB_Yru_GN1]|uniref:Uncharacterized protein n=1 Tax=Yersinia phage vB_Yru_GN1 TaxID=3074381 RepID=A0AA86IWU5_9CAUD|nr:hypothetical protein [Yersinia phage vB_Yru_GN1]
MSRNDETENKLASMNGCPVCSIPSNDCLFCNPTPSNPYYVGDDSIEDDPGDCDGPDYGL